MKRSFTILLITLTLVFSFSCCTKSNRSFTPESFESFVLVETPQEKYKGKFVFKTGDSISLNLTYPEILNGVVITSEKGAKTVQHGGVSISLGKSSPVYKVCDILADFSKKQHFVKGEDDVSISGDVDGVLYEIVVDCKNMKIKEIITSDVRCVFSNESF